MQEISLSFATSLLIWTVYVTGLHNQIFLNNSNNNCIYLNTNSAESAFLQATSASGKSFCEGSWQSVALIGCAMDLTLLVVVVVAVVVILEESRGGVARRCRSLQVCVWVRERCRSLDISGRALEADDIAEPVDSHCVARLEHDTMGQTGCCQKSFYRTGGLCREREILTGTHPFFLLLFLIINQIRLLRVTGARRNLNG